MGAYAPGSFIRYSDLSVVKDETNIPPALSMVTKLHEDNMKVIEELKKAQELAVKHKCDGLQNYLQERIDIHFKYQWMLKATLKASVISEAPKARAIKVSLRSPVIRDSMVILLTLAAADSKFTG